MNTQPCRSCQAKTFFAKGPRGGSMIFDAEPVGADSIKGLWVLTGNGETARAAQPADKGPFYKSHFSSCPQREQWRRARPKAKA